MPINDVELIGRLSFGKGELGRGALATPQEQAEFAHELQLFVKPFTAANTADCVEDRPTVALANGETDPAVLAERVVPQVPGGLGLSFTKIAVASGAAYLRDVRSFKEAYEKTVDMLVAFGYEDAGHENCGASLAVESSVAEEVPEDDVMATLPALTTVDEQTLYYLRRNWEAKRQLLESGFFGDWDPAWREDFLAQRFPHNFAFLPKNADNKPIDHEAEALLVIRRPGFGLAKTGLVQATRRMAFADTPGIFTDLVRKFGGSQEEQARMLLEASVDPVQVLNGLAAETMPVFQLAA